MAEERDSGAVARTWSLRDSDLNVGGDYLEVVIGGADGILGFHIADNGEVIEGGIALAAHAVKQIENWILRGIEVLPREFEDGDVMAELSAGTLPVAQHQSE